MNNKSDSFEHFELISAYLDGEVTQEERAFIEENPDLVKEVEKLKEIQKITSSPIPVDPLLQEKHLTKALSSLPESEKVIPFRQQKMIQRGTLLAVAAAAAAFILVPVINSQNKSNSESDLATSFIENSTPITKSAQSTDSRELEDTSVVPESGEDSGTTTEASRNSQASQNNEPESEAATDSRTPSAPAEDQILEDETVGEIEEETMEVTQEETDVEAQQLETSEEIAEELSPRVFIEEAENIDSLLETANNIWETNNDIFSSPLAPNQIENFFSENTDFLTCWIDQPFFDTSIRTPLFLQQLIINGSPSVVLISEDLQSELNPVLSIYQVDSSCSLFFEGTISSEIDPE